MKEILKKKKSQLLKVFGMKETVVADDLLIAVMDSKRCQKKTTMSSTNLSAVIERTTGSASPSTSKNAGQLFFFFFLLGWLLHFSTVRFAARYRPSVVANLYLLPVACTQNRINRHKQFKRKGGRANQRQAVRVIS